MTFDPFHFLPQFEKIIFMDYRKSELHRAEVCKNLGYTCAAFVGALVLHLYLIELIFDYKLLIRASVALVFLAIANAALNESYSIIKKEENRINATTNPRRDS